MVKLLKRVASKLFKTAKPEITYPVLKTRAQLISEGRGAYVPKRATHGSPFSCK